MSSFHHNGALRLIALAMFVVAMFVAGCAKEPARVARPASESSEARRVHDMLNQRATRVRTLRASGRLFAWDRGEMVTDLAVVVAPPNRLRIEAFDALADVTFAVGASGKRAWVWIPAEDKVYRGRASRRNIRRVMNVDWSLHEFVNMLSGIVDIDENEALQRKANDRNTFVAYDGSFSVKMDMRRGVPLLVTQFRRVDGQPAPQREVRFEHYRDAGGILFPRRIVAHVPGRGARVVVEYDDVVLNKDIEDSVFEAPR